MICEQNVHIKWRISIIEKVYFILKEKYSKWICGVVKTLLTKYFRSQKVNYKIVSIGFYGITLSPHNMFDQLKNRWISWQLNRKNKGIYDLVAYGAWTNACGEYWTFSDTKQSQMPIWRTW